MSVPGLAALFFVLKLRSRAGIGSNHKLVELDHFHKYFYIGFENQEENSVYGYCKTDLGSRTGGYTRHRFI
jgi:hypothetical protein